MTTVSMPALGESVDEGTVLTWLKAVGDPVLAEEPLLEVATDKVDTEVPSPVSGTIRQLLVEPGAVVPVGAGIAVIDDEAVELNPVVEGAPQATGFLSPLVRKLAREHDVALAGLAGTGRHGRIRKQDVLAAIEGSRPVATPPPASPAPSTAEQPAELRSGPLEPGERREPMTRVRRSIASAMMSSLHTSAQLTSVAEVDVTDIARTRSHHKEAFKARTGIALSYLPFFAAAAVAALNEHPMINARLEDDDIVYSTAVHLGIAVDSDRGLFVPVIRQASDLSVQGLARAIADVAEKTRTGSLQSDDLGGGTFTITNTGSRGALFDTPIINAPQSAILGTGAVVERTAVVTMADGTKSIAIRSMAYLSLSYDHRIIDGAVAAGYLTTVKGLLESDDWGSQVR